MTVHQYRCAFCGGVVYRSWVAEYVSGRHHTPEGGWCEGSLLYYRGTAEELPFDDLEKDNDRQRGTARRGPARQGGARRGGARLRKARVL